MTTISATTSAPTRPQWRVSSAVKDLVEGLGRWELWSTLGWHDIRQRYQRSTVGPFWLTLSMGAMIGGLAYLYGGVFGNSVVAYLPYVAVGMIVFTFVTSMANDAAMAFITSASVIVQIKAPLSVYIYQIIWRNILMLAHNSVIYLVVIAFIPVTLGWNTLLFIPGLFLLIGMGIWTGLILAPLCARFRDVPPIISSIMQIAFFMTPIFWTPGSLPNREHFIYLNPFYYLVEVVRMPLLGESPPLSIWLTVVVFNCVAATIAIVFFARCRARIAYWV